ncbi:MAG: hypothetical protein Q9166_000044 [cf. Caloplaca sp. 2 TL-2023]
MKEVGVMIDQDNGLDHVQETRGDQPSTSSMNKIQPPESPVIPVVVGFTPINRSSTSATPAETSSTPVPVPEPDKGKKRQRKPSVPATATPKATKATRWGQLKKAMRGTAHKTQNITQAFTLKKPTAHALIDQQGKVHGASSSPTVLPEAPRTAISPQTCQVSLFTSGLSSTYQAAFQQEEQQRMDVQSNVGLPLSDNVTENAMPMQLDRPLVKNTQPSASEGSMQRDFGLPHLSGGAEDNSMPESLAGLTCEMSGLSEITLCPAMEQILPDREDEECPMAPALMSEPASKCEGNPADNSQPGDESKPIEDDVDDGIDFPSFDSFDDFLPTGVKDDSLSLGVDTVVGPVCLSDRTNEQDVILCTSPEAVVDSSDLSFFSDIDLLLSRYDDHLVGLSTSQPLVESSSPCLQSHSGHQSIPLSPKACTPDKHSPDEDIYDDEEIDTGFLDFQSPTSAQVPPFSPPSSPSEKPTLKHQRLAPGPITPAASPEKSAVSSPLGISLSTPVMETSARTSEDMPHKVSFNQIGAAIPFIRPPFPNAIRDRSPVLGFSSRTLLRTCFRIGEALNAGSTALRTRTDAVIELYARVSYSERPAGSVKQHFHFADIFSPDKPPFLKGTYGLWKGVGIWDLDSKVFLGEKGKGKMARVVGRIGREEKTRGLKMTVLSIWEAGWEDVGICKGHYCG